ncbi:MAG: D-2-hydroxyacid dehydrogenase [Flavobacteriales bacterium]|nr:D-2-hydroxyacid dehydrogenase [Flavobacteriales bacterium]
MKILANDGIAEAAKIRLESEGITVHTDHIEQSLLVDAINREGYEGLLVRSATKVREPLIDACPDLRFIGRGGVGVDNIDVEYARSKGRVVFNTPAASSQSVAELVMAHLFGMARFLPSAYRVMPEQGATEFKKFKKAFGGGIELRGKTLGIIGFGRIGRSVAQYALGCGMEVVASDLSGTEHTVNLVIGGQTVAVKVPSIPLDELLKRSDAISLHVPSQANGRAVIGTDELAKMKRGAMLVNTARGGTVDEAAICAALESGQLRSAALDVFSGEPNPNPKVLSAVGLALTPHTGAATVEAQDRIGDELVEQILALR